MGIFNFLSKAPPKKDDFARMLLKRIRKSGDQRPVTYDSAGFRFVTTESRVLFLDNIYQEYLRADGDEQKSLINNFLAMWYTTELPVPDEFSDVKADLLPALRARSFLEIDVQLAGGKEMPPPPYETIGDHLALMLVYDLPTSMMTINDEALEKWGITFYEAMEVARQNLGEKPIQCAQIGSAYAAANGDGYDATRMISLDFIRQLKIPGEVVAMVPNRERLYIAGSDDPDGLAFMLEFAEKDVQHERFISGIAFRLDGDAWEPWLPPENHALFDRFRKLRLETMGQMYAAQAELLNKRHQQNGTDIFVASFSGMTEQSTGRVSSYCMWAENVDSLLPETDEVFLVRPNEKSVTTAARGSWDVVRQQANDLMEPQGTYPERWRVRSFPDASVLAKIGNK
jgi:hypothetical protein